MQFYRELEQEVNSSVCPDCGKHHTVVVSVKGDAISPSFSKDTCTGFVLMFNRSLKAKTRDFPLRFLNF